MLLNAHQQAAQRNLSYLLAEKIAQRVLSGEYPEGAILPGENELGGIFGVSRTAVREAVKTLTAKGMLLPRPRIGTRVMPQSSWNFLDQELLTWWMTRENFDQVMALPGYQYADGVKAFLTRSVFLLLHVPQSG